MAESMTYGQLSDLAERAAAQLGQLRAETWAVDPQSANRDRNHPSADLVNTASGARLRIVFGWFAPGKVTVEGRFPEGTGCRHDHRANVAPERGARAVAQAADARVLRSGYTDELPGMIKRKAEQEEQYARAVRLTDRVAELFGTSADERGGVYVGNRVRGQGRVSVYYSEDRGALNLDISGIPADVALAMLAVLAGRTDPAPTCCDEYGPDHRASWAGPYCRQHATGSGELKPFSREAEQAYDEYLSSGEWQRLTWKQWLNRDYV
jgi:hypothetical protein